METAANVIDKQPDGATISGGRSPHGLCECRYGCQCAMVTGPAAYQIERDGKAMKVCTRCDLSGDRNKRLLVTRDEPLGPYERHDALGALAILLALEGE